MDIEAVRKLWASAETHRAACIIYDAIPMSLRPAWAADILKLSCSRWPAPPSEVLAVIEIGHNRRRLQEAHNAFSAVRRLTLAEDASHAGGKIYLSLLVTAENVAKVIYNASGVKEPIKPGELAPFDDDCGYWLVGCLRHLVVACGSPEFEQQAWALLESWLRRAATAG